MLIDYMGWFKQYKLQQVRLLLLEVSTSPSAGMSTRSLSRADERSSPSAG